MSALKGISERERKQGRKRETESERGWIYLNLAHSQSCTEQELSGAQPKHSEKSNMSSPQGADIDLDADFVYDYHTLRVGGLVFAGVIVFLSVIMLAGNKLLNCGKSKPRHVEEE
ncbi:hypothetical protein WMY93_028757 [Mugilogobius chulae]|uniref:FXYD domain-containing ion transport regulator n=1 Tax=Mugilogobius chulae TaxID=88201 RepID=A0AAW0MVY2_9GOBI